MTNEVQSETEPDVAEDLQDVTEGMAGEIAKLSLGESAIEGGSIVAPINAEDVDFKSSAWLLDVVQVQDWLHLGRSISAREAEDNPGVTAKVLFEEMGVSDADSCLLISEGLVTLALRGTELLSERLELAVKLQEEFFRFSEGMTTGSATERWNELWEEEQQPEEGVEHERINAITEDWPISDFVTRAQMNKLNLNPTYQRGDVWNLKESQKLIESVLRGIPLPSVILLKKSGGVFEVVDGKQRLTSVLRFIGKHPVALKRVEDAHVLHPDVGFKAIFHDDYAKFRRLWKTHMSESLTGAKEKEHFFPFKLSASTPAMRGHLSPLAGKYYCKVLAEPVGESTVLELFTMTCDYKVPVIQYRDATTRQIHDVFSIYNKQGVHLNAEEIRNALYHERKLPRMLLVASGDSRQVEELAPFIQPGERDKLSDIAGMLMDYKFGVSRYKRTKILSWLLSLALQPSRWADGKYYWLTTAKHIDAMFDGLVADDTSGPLESDAVLEKILWHVHKTLEVHGTMDASWSPEFKDLGVGTKWTELQLVASLLGVFFLVAVREDALGILEANQEGLREFTRTHLRPSNAQTSSQWGFIAKIALGVLDIAGVDHAEAGAEVESRYGTNCIPTLEAAVNMYVPRDGL